MTDEKTLVHTVNDAHNMRLDRWLRREHETLHQGMIEKLVRQGKIRVNGNKVTSSYRLQNDQQVTIPIFITRLPKKDLEKSREQELPPLTQEDVQAIESWTLWEDGELLVLNKPHGLAVQGGSKTSYHLDGLLKALGHKNKCTYRLVHRLDKDTSGVFLVAKTGSTAAHLAEAFRLGLHEKIYWAVVVGFASPGQGKIDDRLIKGLGGTGDKEKVRVDPNGQTALTHYRTLKKLAKKRYPELTCLELRPQTGRTHQLRVHCAHKGFPILGDGKYGGRAATQDHKKLHLHARSISIKDSHGNNLTFVAPPPDYFEETVQAYDIDWTQF